LILRINLLRIMLNRWSIQVFLGYFYSWAFYSVINLVWQMIWNLDNLRLFTKSASIFLRITDWSLDLRFYWNLRFNNNSWESSLNVWISIWRSEPFVDSKLRFLYVLWIWFYIDGWSLVIIIVWSRRRNWRKTLRLSLVGWLRS
jgi:hypothetical protein